MPRLLIVTSRGEEYDKLLGFNLGAVLKRSGNKSSDKLIFDELCITPGSRTVSSFYLYCFHVGGADFRDDSAFCNGDIEQALNLKGDIYVQYSIRNIHPGCGCKKLFKSG